MNISSAQAADIELILEAEASELQRIYDSIRALETPVVRASRLFSIAAANAKSEKLSEALIREGLFIASFARRTGKDAAHAMESLKLGLLRRKEWTLGRFDERKSQLDLLGKIVDSDSICVAAKAIDLSFDFDRILTNARLVTDIRPVLNRDQSQPVGAVLQHGLHLSYFENDRPFEMTIALDDDDLRTLISVCGDALKKSETARIFAEKSVPKDNIFIVGEEHYGFN